MKLIFIINLLRTPPSRFENYEFLNFDLGFGFLMPKNYFFATFFIALSPL